MTETLDDVYLSWLYNQVGDVKGNTSETYWNLLRQMNDIEFVWLVPNDDNRVGDGRDIRHEWASENGVDLRMMDLGCSFLEMMIGLCRRLAFEADEGEAADWFWHLIRNLGLQSCTDQSDYNREEVDERINAVIWRTYSRRGHGGLFPLRNPRRDQRDVELWYQMSAYLMET